MHNFHHSKTFFLQFFRIKKSQKSGAGSQKKSVGQIIHADIEDNLIREVFVCDRSQEIMKKGSEGKTLIKRFVSRDLVFRFVNFSFRCAYYMNYTFNTVQY
jgi:hypothetical protein